MEEHEEVRFGTDEEVSGEEYVPRPTKSRRSRFIEVVDDDED